MQRRLTVLILAAVLIMAFAYIYKNYGWDDSKEGNGFGQLPEYPNGGERVSQQMVDIFPRRIGHEWFYSGFAEYSHRMRLDSIHGNTDNTETLVYKVSGMVDDVSDGEASGDFSFELEYIITKDTVIERIIRGEKLPNMFNEMQILKLPLETGAKWEQKIDIDGEEMIMIAEVLSAELEKEIGTILYKMRYSVPMPGMPRGIYTEERAFAKGKGLIYYSRTLEEESGLMFQYSAFERDND